MCARKKIPTTYPPLVFNVYKPKGMTSFEVVGHFKRHLPKGFGKIGHFGTLDPFAEGVLLIGVGGASRLAQILNDCLPKVYEATGRVGVKTDTGDRTGEVIARDEEVATRAFTKLSDMEIDSIFSGHFLGDYYQSPQAFSAAKHEGKPLYEYARAGVMIEKEPVLRHIYKIEVQHFELPYLKFISEVSSGTYIRVLFEDMMKLFETYGSLEELKRIGIGHHLAQDALREADWPLNGLHSSGTEYDLTRYAIPMTEALPLREVTLSAQDLVRYLSGHFPDDAKVSWAPRAGLSDSARELSWVYAANESDGRDLIGLAQWAPEMRERPKVLFNLPRT